MWSVHQEDPRDHTSFPPPATCFLKCHHGASVMSVGSRRCGGCCRAFWESNESNQFSPLKNKWNCLPAVSRVYTLPEAPDRLFLLSLRASLSHFRGVAGLLTWRSQSLKGLTGDGKERKGVISAGTGRERRVAPESPETLAFKQTAWIDLTTFHLSFEQFSAQLWGASTANTRLSWFFLLTSSLRFGFL